VCNREGEALVDPAHGGQTEFVTFMVRARFVDHDFIAV
jgi:hypothetical protein